MSDLHVDDAPYALPDTPADVNVIIIAGDVADGHHRSIRWLREHAVPKGLPVIYVLGNHDYYGGDIRDDADDWYRSAGITLLHAKRPMVEIHGIRFIGCTLWTDYAVSDDLVAAMWWAKMSMPDFSNIDYDMRRLVPKDLLTIHRNHLGLLAGLLTEYEESRRTVVVTHHAPHPASLNGGRARDPSDGSFASDLTSVIEVGRPELWIHGHVHQSRNYRAGRTRMICNPRGYVGAHECGGFEPLKVVEL